MNGDQEWQEGPPKLKRVGPTTCGYCEATFSSTDALRAHKLKKVKDESNNQNLKTPHLYCEICDLDFHTLGGVGSHRRQMHPHKQEFECPACAMKFQTLSNFIQHVETGQCSNLDIEALQARFADKLNFARGLGQRDLASRAEFPVYKQKDFSLYLGHDALPEPSWQEAPNMLSHWEAADTNTWASWNPTPAQGKEFPRMAHHEYLHGSSNDPDLLTGNQTNQLDGKYEENDWSRPNNLFPESRPAQRPTAEQLQALNPSKKVAVEPARGQDGASLDPNSPYFDPQQFWHEILQKYKCPHFTVCKKSFNKKAAFVQHLKSANHSGTKFMCPCCRDQFDFLYALAAHVESPSRKCKINGEFDEQDMYRIFLDQLTLGMVECGGVLDDDTQKFKLVDKFKSLYEPRKTSDPTFGHRQVHGFGSAGDSVATGRSGLTEAALSKHQQQLGKDGARLAHPGRRLDNGPRGSGPEVALTADALSRLQVQEKHGSPWGQRSPVHRQQQQQPQQEVQQQHQHQQQPAAGAQATAPQQNHVSYVGQQLGALGWDTWDRCPRPRKEDQGRLANSKKSDWGW